jgi:hypothetical protein
MLWGVPLQGSGAATAGGDGAEVGAPTVALARLVIEETHKAPFGRPGTPLNDQEVQSGCMCTIEVLEDELKDVH